MTNRFILWFAGMILSFGAGLYLDHRFKTLSFPLYIRALAGIVLVFAAFLLARSGRLLRKLGKPKEEWGWTTELVTTDLYRCLRHPHHLGIGLFITAFSAALGSLWTFLFVTFFIWTAILWFLKSVEEPELFEKFNGKYAAYREKIPMLFPSPCCLFRVIFKK